MRRDKVGEIGEFGEVDGVGKVGEVVIKLFKATQFKYRQCDYYSHVLFIFLPIMIPL